MKVVALLSGGKDSLYNMYLCKKEGHEIVAIANLRPPEEKRASGDELDSYMYQTVGHQALDFVAKALDIPIFRANIMGTSKNKDLEYTNKSQTDSEVDEVEELFALLRDIRDINNIHFDAVSVGAIASSYQNSRVEHVCRRLNLAVLAKLWNREQDQLLQDMIDNGFEAILIKVACMGLSKEHLGKSIREMQPYLRKLHKEYETNICGEGGEYETLVLDCPMYKKRLSLEQHEVICHSDDVFAPVYYIKPTKISLIDKNCQS